MTLVLKFLRINDTIASSTAILSNFVLLFLIFTAQKSNIKTMSQALLQNCILDSCLALILLLAQPQVVVINDIYYNIIGSPLYSLGFPFASAMMSVFGPTLNLCISALPIPFYIRYLKICKNIDVKVKHLILPYCLVFGYGSIIYGLCMYFCPPFAENCSNWREQLMTDFWLEEYKKGPVFIAYLTTDLELIITFSLMFISISISYCLIIFFSLKITHHLRGLELQMSERTKILHKQLQLTLTIQASGPLLTATGPFSCLLLMVMLKYENYYVSLIICSSFSWLAVINPIAAMLIVAPYRQRIKALLRLQKNPITYKLDPNGLNIIPSNNQSTQTNPGSTFVTVK